MRNKHRSWEEQRRVDQQNDYDFSHTEQVKLKLNKKTDNDVLSWLYGLRWQQGKSIQGEIKRLIREEIAREEEIARRCTPTEADFHS